jgi:hypothetical protein
MRGWNPHDILELMLELIRPQALLELQSTWSSFGHTFPTLGGGRVMMLSCLLPLS